MAEAGPPSPKREAAELWCFAASQDVKWEVRAAVFLNRESQRESGCVLPKHVSS